MGARSRFGETVQVKPGVSLSCSSQLVAYFVALRATETIFELAIQYAFSGFPALCLC